MPAESANGVGVSTRVRDQLSRIFAPVEVATPPIDAMRELMMLPFGQVRHYGFRGSHRAAHRIYIASDDCGLSWQEYDTPPKVPGAVTQSPWSGDFITVVATHELPKEVDGRSILGSLDEGIWLFRSTNGVDGDYSEPSRSSPVPTSGCRASRWHCIIGGAGSSPANGSTPNAVSIRWCSGRMMMDISGTRRSCPPGRRTNPSGRTRACAGKTTAVSRPSSSCPPAGFG